MMALNPLNKMNIMVAVDGSEHSLAAVQLLCDLPLPADSAITAVSVLVPRNASDHARLAAILEHVKTLFQDRYVTVSTELLVGSPADELTEFAERHHPDLVILGAKGLRATLGILLGGVAQRVIEYAPCPILIVRAPYEGLHQVLLVTDGSPHSQRAVEYLADFPVPGSAHVQLIHVMPPLPSPTLIAHAWPIDAELFIPPTSAESEEALNRQAEEEEKAGRALLQRTEKTLYSHGLKASGVLKRGDAASEILEFIKSNQIDLVVAGSRGLSRMQSWLLGSVSRKLVHYANCSVLIVKGAQFHLQIDCSEIQAYLERHHGASVKIQEVRQLGSEARGAEAIKQFGFGRPISVKYEVPEKTEQIVIHIIARNAFGRQLDSDRVAAIWLDYQTFNNLPRHVKAVDMLVRSATAQLESIGDADDLLLVTVYQPGKAYAEDLTRIRDTGKIDDRDIHSAETLATFLAEIHKTKHDESMLWRRRLRDLIGHGEGIMGIADSYPRDREYATEQMLRTIEELANRWRWRLKPFSHRLSQVHGDFHPFNVLFEGDHEFHLLDRSRGEWGEPADDVSCMAINYLFFSLQRSGVLEGAFKELHDVFWASYISQQPDDQLVEVIQPWFTWRALVVASPVWYPTISTDIRRRLLNFARQVLLFERYDFHK